MDPVILASASKQEAADAETNHAYRSPLGIATAAAEAVKLTVHAMAARRRSSR